MSCKVIILAELNIAHEGVLAMRQRTKRELLTRSVPIFSSWLATQTSPIEKDRTSMPTRVHSTASDTLARRRRG